MSSADASMVLRQEDKQAYLLALLSAIAADGVFSAEEMIRIYSLFSILGIDKGVRQRLLQSLISAGYRSAEASALPEGILQSEQARSSLAKDMMFLESQSDDNQTLHLIRGYLKRLNLTPEQSNVIRNFVSIENQILDKLGAGQEWKADADSWKELVSRAAAVGVPLAALNMAGIAGFGAAGITSGLAALGSMSGLVVLGLNPMTAGIGALILGGVAVKKIADFALSGDDPNSSPQHVFQQSRVAAREALAADLPVISRGRKRELLLFQRKRRRRALVRGMEAAQAVLKSS